jgi:hypothetical protein
MEKQRVTITLRQDQHDRLVELAEDDNPRYDSKSEAARHLFDRVDDLEDDIEELELTVERLQNEKQVLIEKHQQSEELALYKEEEQFIEDASFRQRVKWLVFGKDD